MIPLMRREVVEKRGWLTEDEFIDAVALSQSSPGPIAVNIAVFVGNKLHKTRGSVATSLGVIIPPFITILAIAVVFTQFKDNPAVVKVLKGMRPAVVALIVTPIYMLSKGMKWPKLAAAAAVAALVGWLNVSPVYLIIAGAVASLCYLIVKERRRAR